MSAFFDAVIINRNVSVENVKKVFTFFLFLHAGMNKNTNIVPTIMWFLAVALLSSDILWRKNISINIFVSFKIELLNPDKNIYLQPILVFTSKEIVQTTFLYFQLVAPKVNKKLWKFLSYLSLVNSILVPKN